MHRHVRNVIGGIDTTIIKYIIRRCGWLPIDIDRTRPLAISGGITNET